MDPFVVLANRAAEHTRRDLGHSALPGAPVQPFVTKRSRWRELRRTTDVVANATVRLARRAGRAMAVRRRVPLRSSAVTRREVNCG
jgi:hypothetical protein